MTPRLAMAVCFSAAFLVLSIAALTQGQVSTSIAALVASGVWTLDAGCELHATERKP